MAYLGCMIEETDVATTIVRQVGKVTRFVARDELMERLLELDIRR